MRKSNSVWKTSLVQLNLLGRKGGRVHYLHFHLIKFQIVHLIRQSVALTQLVRPKTKPEIPSELCKLILFFFAISAKWLCAWVSFTLVGLKGTSRISKSFGCLWSSTYALSMWGGGGMETFIHRSSIIITPFAYFPLRPQQSQSKSIEFPLDSTENTHNIKKKKRKAKQSGKFKSKTKTTEDLRH